ncbi:MAG: peptidoglycan DD-metalloendopeptidase family protein [Gemmatimonadota bacterium]|nr:peptidoglycan DD-metalloendopeptidase family protein [Gemmatimonadota bacterium]
MNFLVAVIVLTSTSCTMIGSSEFETPSPEITDNRPESGEVGTDDAVASLEDRRRELELPTSSELSMSIGDAGSLEWPLDGDLIYRFGQEHRPNGLVLNWNGVGIAGLPGSPVRAARNGLIVLAGPFEGYGPSVVLSHGDGFYSLYLYLEEIRVAEGRSIDMGHVIGTVGGTDTAQGPHIEFQVRAPIDGGVPEAQDPLEWLKPRAGG